MSRAPKWETHWQYSTFLHTFKNLRPSQKKKKKNNALGRWRTDEPNVKLLINQLLGQLCFANFQFSGRICGYRCRFFVRRPCRNDNDWPPYGKWRKFDEEDKKKEEKAKRNKNRGFPRIRGRLSSLNIIYKGTISFGKKVWLLSEIYLIYWHVTLW